MKNRKRIRKRKQRERQKRNTSFGMANKKAMYGVILAVLCIALVIVVIELNLWEEKDVTTSSKYVQQESKANRVNETETVDNTVYKVNLLAVGDNLISDSIIHCGLNSDGSYDFSELFQHVRDDIQAADLAVINQETILGGPQFEYVGYPNFNSPDEVGDAVIDAGFDLVLQASNHSYDRGVEGIKHDIKYWNKHPNITMIGLNKNRKNQQKIKVIEVNNVKLAVLNYTYGLNGYQLPEEQDYLVNLIDEDKIAQDIKAAEQLADFTIVFPHWGVEYVHEPNEEQKSLAKMMVENGADLIIGTHPHVMETIEWVKSNNGNKALCYYSLGNFTSTQDQTATMLGGMAKLTIVKKGERVYIKKGAGVVPLATHYEFGEGRINTTYKLSDYTEDLASRNDINSFVSDFSKERLEEIAQEVVGDWIVQ